MRVLLLGATGHLGQRCVQACIARGHELTIYIRNEAKLHSLMSPALLDLAHAIVVGDATDVALLTKVMLDHDIEGVIDVAGNQVLPWKEYMLSKIAKAVADAAVDVKRQTGRKLRLWVISGLGLMQYPGTPYLISEFFPARAHVQHDATRDVIVPFPLEDLSWSILAISWMTPAYSNQGLYEPLAAPRQHSIIAKADEPPMWKGTWLKRIPIIGGFLAVMWLLTVEYKTVYEDVADFLAEDLLVGGEQFVGKKVGVIMAEKRKVA